MRIYLSASYARKIRMAGLAQHLRKCGYSITSTWIDENTSDDGIAGVIPADYGTMQKHALVDLADLRGSDIMLFFSEPEWSRYSRGGRHVEFGYAMALHIPIITVGRAENIFHTLDGVAVIEDVDALLSALQTMQGRLTEEGKLNG